jgi:hypothetical protein
MRNSNFGSDATGNQSTVVVDKLGDRMYSTSNSFLLIKLVKGFAQKIGK